MVGQWTGTGRVGIENGKQGREDVGNGVREVTNFFHRNLFEQLWG